MNMDEIFDKIKSYADVAIDQAGKFGKSAASKTENVVSRAKVKYAINETEGQIKAIYTALGEKVYRKYLEGGDITGDWAEDCEKISGFNAEIEALNTQLAELRESVKCGECGAYNSIESTFCAKCGAKLSEAGEEIADDIEAAADKIVDAAEKVSEKVESVAEEVADAIKPDDE